MVDVMFEILSLNEREIQDSLNITDSFFLNGPFALICAEVRLPGAKLQSKDNHNVQ